ncbi:MAG: class I tRNA ligase family protein [bacterium]|nr:class I tRNA ligase family protein [bacterium]
MQAYDHHEIEKRAQEKWASFGLYEADLKDESKDPYYLLTEFPYPSGDLHIGHWYAFAVTDIFARFKRMQGKNVLFPIGFDAFGLPAENAAMKHGLDPKKWTYENMERMREQLRSMGASFDWSKEVITCEPNYYKWTQWLFTKLMEHGLAYRKEAAVKWCPKDQTVLANEQVIDGRCERCGTEVEEKRLTQWFLKITEYAERLLKDLEPLPWREEIKEAQMAWIGKSEGAKIKFELRCQGVALPQGDAFIEVFTTRPDTIFGATYMVLAPEHALVSKLLDLVSNKKEVEKYIATTKKKTERERSENKEKTGVKLEGVSAINPATKEEIPIYIADYVLATYGTGAVMAVPAHDERDFDFSVKYGLPIRQVVEPLFVRTTNADAARTDLPFEKRDSVACVIKHWSEDKFLCIKWRSVPWNGFVTGGIDGEPLEIAGAREILEETGYKNAKFVRALTGAAHAQFYHANKKVNRWARFQGAYFELTDGERDPITDEEKAICDIKWIPRKEVETFVTAPEIKLIWKQLMEGESAYTGPGILANSGEFTGKGSEEAKADIVKFVRGEKTTNYRLRDWLVSRQRYWGCPIPVVYDPEGKPHAISAEHLPWLLPTDVDFTPTGKAPLASSKELKERVEKIFGKGWTPEYDTLDTFVDSSWYFLRYLDHADDHDFSDNKLMKKWLPVNRYSGGSEHTTMHLLYARFFQKALFDLSLVPTSEPFNERFNRGIILGPDGAKMSKSKGNVINPDEFVAKFGADAVRVYLVFIGPYNEPGSYPWNLDGVAAMRKFLERVARMVEKVGHRESTPSITRALERAKAKVSEDTERFKFNTAIAALMTLLNEFEKEKEVGISAVRDFVILLAPFAPHLAENLWAKLSEGKSPDASGEASRESVHQVAWPDALVAEEGEREIVVQINGKKRGATSLTMTASEAEAVTEALKIPAVAAALAGKSPKRVIYVAGRVLNIVI